MKKLKIQAKTLGSRIISNNQVLEIVSIKSDISLISLLKDQFIIQNLVISSKSIEVEKDIIEIKYQPKYANFCKNFILKNNLNNRNQKFSKYVNSFIELNDSGIL